VSYAQARDIFGEIGQVPISTSSLWRRTQKWGRALRQAEQERVEAAHQLPQEEIIAGQVKDRERMGLGMDGAMLYILGEGWKELKLGSVFEVEQRATFIKETLEWEDLGHATHTSYVAYLGGPERFGEYLWSEAAQRGWNRTWETQVVGDGAVWIWNLAGEHFFDSHQVVDWYHATQHLAQAAQFLYGEEPSPAKQRWLNEQKEHLFQGQAEGIAQLLRDLAAQLSGTVREGLAQEATYFATHKRRMKYWEIREEGWVMGSGMVESGAKQYKHRFTGPGMRWSREGAERLLPIRSAIMSDTFDQAWQTVYNSP
jgi:hypothetical protein